MFLDSFHQSVGQRWVSPLPGLGTVEDDTREGKYGRSYRPHSKMRLIMFNCFPICLLLLLLQGVNMLEKQQDFVEFIARVSQLRRKGKEV